MEIILYESHSAIKTHQPLFRPPKISFFLHLAGTAIMAVAFSNLVIIFGPPLIKEAIYRFKNLQSAPYQPLNQSVIKTVTTPDQIAQEATGYGVRTDFALVIPKIAAAANILPNVNPADEKSYRKALKNGVAHAAGTSFPGQGGTIYLFAHSTNSPANIARYNAVFYLLKELRKNDEIIIFYAGQKYIYQVTDYFITAAEDTQWLTKQATSETLILQTCWPPGTSQKRLLVIAKRLN